MEWQKLVKAGDVLVERNDKWGLRFYHIVKRTPIEHSQYLDVIGITVGADDPEQHYTFKSLNVTASIDPTETTDLGTPKYYVLFGDSWASLADAKDLTDARLTAERKADIDVSGEKTQWA